MDQETKRAVLDYAKNGSLTEASELAPAVKQAQDLEDQGFFNGAAAAAHRAITKFMANHGEEEPDEDKQEEWDLLSEAVTVLVQEGIDIRTRKEAISKWGDVEAATACGIKDYDQAEGAARLIQEALRKHREADKKINEWYQATARPIEILTLRITAFLEGKEAARQEAEEE